jgi:hypothetical protein
MNLCFVEFAIASEEQFRQLEAVVAALCEAKKTNLFPPAAYWLDFFDAKATSFFWHPTEPEFKDWKRRWFATPVEERWNEQTLETPWDFDSMIGAFEDGDYELLGCHRLSDTVARLNFSPYGSPYGGTGCMQALIEAFGHQVTSVLD